MMRKNLCSLRKSNLGAILLTIASAQTNMGKTWTSLVTAMNYLSRVTALFCVLYLKMC